MPKYLRRTLKIFLWLFGILIVLLIGAYFFIQTQTFNKLVLEYTVSKLNKSWELKESKLNVASIHGNILKGIRADYGSIVVKEDTLLDFSYLDVKYDIWGLFNHEIRVEHATLNSPRINLIKLKYNKDSLIWNFMNLFASAEEKDTSVSEFDWDLTLEKLRIENGHFKVAGNLDENNPEWKYGSSKQDTFDFNNLDITNFEMELDARYFKNFKNISIKNLSFNTNSDFNLRKFVLDGNINMKDTVSDLWGIEMVTDRSKIKIDKIHMEEFSPFNKIVYDNWGNKDFEVKLNIEKFNFADLKFFLPELDFLDSTAGLILNVDGKYGDLNIHELSLKLPNSEINLKGKLVNLQDPENLYIDARIDSLKLYPHDALTVIKIPSVPDYSNLGMVYGNIYYKGRIDNFYSEYDLRTGAGNIRGVTNLDINYESFNGYVTTAGLNLGKVLKSRELNSNLNLSAKFSGNGFGPGRIASINYSMAGSSISGYHINRSSGNIQARGNSLTINTNTSTSAGSATVRGRINIANTNNPSYVLKGRVTGLDVSKITKNPEDQSSLNMSFDVSGRGTNLNNINGKYNFVVSQSTYGGHQLPETPLNIEINAGGGQSSVVLASEMADFNAKGRFDIGSAVNTVQYNISSFIDAVLGRINSQGTDIRVTNTTNVVSKDMNLDFELVVKDTAKLNETLQPFGISFNGDIKGNMVNSPNGFKTEMIVNVNDFKYKDTSIIIKNFNSGLTFENTYRYVSANSLSPYKIVLNSNAEKIKIGSNNIDSAKVGFNMANASAVLLARGIQDSLTYGKINANFDLTGANVEAKVDSIYIHYHKYEIANNNTWLIDYLPGTEVNFKEVGIRSKNAVVNLNGNYVFDGNSDIKIEGNNMNVVDIYDILSPPDTTIIIGKRHKYPVSGNISQLYFNFKGTTDKPELDLKMTTDVLKYRQDNIGTISADVNYKDEVLTPNIVFQNTNNGGSLKLTGEIPYQNPLIAHDTVIELYYNPVSLRLKADNFQMNNFSKLYPGIGDLRGVLKGNITAAGTVSNPELRGALVVNNGQYYLDLTGMNYNFDFDMTTENSKLVVEKLTIYHTNDRARHFDLTGDIDFAGMKINDINLTGGGSLVLLDETADENQLQVEGYLYGGSGSQPLVIKGNLNKLDVTGQFLIKDAKISSIPLKGSGYNPGEDNFVYISRLPDTLTRYRDSSITVSKEDFEKISPFERYKYRVSQNPSSLMDILNLDVNVKTEKNINVAIDFKNITRDRLYGELTGSMDIKTQDKQINAYGNVEMVGNSYYRFYKDFKLNESKIIFNGQINDPYLDIRAVYNGTKVTEQHGNTANTPVQIVMTLKGSIDKPEITLRLLEDGTEVTGSDAQADAVTFLLFGKYKSELSTSERTAVASSVGTSVGSLYISSFVSQAVTEVLPFVVDAEFIYSPDQTGLQLTSELGEGTITLGGKQVKDVRYFEFNIQYPLNKMIGLNLPETLLLEISKKEVSNSFTTQSTDVKFSTGLKLIYKFKF